MSSFKHFFYCTNHFGNPAEKMGYFHFQDCLMYQKEFSNLSLNVTVNLNSQHTTIRHNSKLRNIFQSDYSPLVDPGCVRWQCPLPNAPNSFVLTYKLFKMKACQEFASPYEDGGPLREILDPRLQLTLLNVNTGGKHTAVFKHFTWTQSLRKKDNSNKVWTPENSNHRPEFSCIFCSNKPVLTM